MARLLSIKKMLKSFGYAANGLRSVVKSEQNFRVHVLAAITAVLLGVCLGISVTEWLFLAGSIVSVMAAEIVNTAIERLCDIVSPEYSEKVKVVKDLAAAAVLIISIGALIVGAVIFLPRLYVVLMPF